MVRARYGNMTIPWKIVRSGFFDGFGAFIRMFGQVRVPGSPIEELNRLTTPESLAEYRAVSPNLPVAILKLKDNVLARDRYYALCTRVLGGIELVAIAIAVCYLALHRRF